MTQVVKYCYDLNTNKGRYMSEQNSENASVETQTQETDTVDVQKLRKKYQVSTMAEKEKKYIVRAIRRCNGNKTHAALCLGMSVKTLYNKIGDYELRKKLIKPTTKKDKQEVQG